MCGVAAACARHRVPLTLRGGATGNYGQCVPLEGGVVLDMTAMNRDRMAEAPAGRARRGRRQACSTSTPRPGRTAGSCACIPRPSAPRRSAASWRAARGGVGTRHLRRPARARQHPRRPHRHAGGDAARASSCAATRAQKINRAYGTTGIITALEMPLAPALAVDRRDRRLRRLPARRCASATPSRSPTASSRSSCRRSRGRCRPISPPTRALPGRQEPAARHDREPSLESFETCCAPSAATITLRAASGG